MAKTSIPDALSRRHWLSEPMDASRASSIGRAYLDEKRSFEAIAFFAKRTNYRFLSVATGFSAGVMLYVSFVEIFVKGTDSLVEAYGDPWGHWVNAASFFGGILLIGIIDNLIPSAENPHKTHTLEETEPLHDVTAPMPDFAAVADFGLLRAAADAADAEGIHYTAGVVHTGDLFYAPESTYFDNMRGMGVLAVEMEAAGLYGSRQRRRSPRSVV